MKWPWTQPENSFRPHLPSKNADLPRYAPTRQIGQRLSVLGRALLDDIAVLVGVSALHLNRLFLKTNGQAVGRMIQTTRLKPALKLLKSDPTKPIKTIAYKKGFSRPAFFTPCFKSELGRLPSQIGD